MKNGFLLLMLALHLAAQATPLDAQLEIDGPPPSSLDFSSDRWEIRDPKAKMETYLGQRGLLLPSGSAMLRDVPFRDGTIEVDVAFPSGRAMAGVIFRARNGNEENIYLRAMQSDHPDALQYHPIFQGAGTWQLFSGPGFTASAVLPTGRWFHLKIEVAGREARLYLDGSAQPALTVLELKQAGDTGTIGVWSLTEGAYFANFSYQFPSQPLPEKPAVVHPLDPRILAAWDLSEVFDGSEKGSETPMPSALRWERVAAETPGMVVIARYRHAPSVFIQQRQELGPVPGRKVIYARTYIDSAVDQSKLLNFGYSDDVTVYLNGVKLFTGKNSYRFRDETSLGIMDVEGDALYLPLRKGRNELVLAVAEQFGGWGYICRIADLANISLSR